LLTLTVNRDKSTNEKIHITALSPTRSPSQNPTMSKRNEIAEDPSVGVTIGSDGNKEVRNVDTIMTLSDVRSNLEWRGFSCVSKPSPSSSSSDQTILVGVQSRFRWDMCATMDVMVFVHQLRGHNLTSERIASDMRDLPMLVYEHYVGGCPPFGLSRARLIVVAYLTDRSIDSDALGRIMQVPKREWCSCTFLAAQDGEGRSYFLEGSAPMWGKALYPELRYWAGLVTGRPTAAELPPRPLWMKLVHLVVILEIVYFAYIYGPTALLHPLAFSLGALLIIALALWVRERNAASKHFDRLEQRGQRREAEEPLVV